ncbi:MAG: hypothetical protein SVX43_01330, partial [Cyanobacteriota bacterium]|nr:hypothetical protein [Cyanobacteriota bacterium]
MEALAYAHSYASYERESGIEIDLPKTLWDWKALPNSAWSNLLAVATFVAILSSTEVAFSNPETNSPDDDMLRGLTDPDGEGEKIPNRSPATPQPSPQETEAVPDRAPAPQPQNNSVTPNSNRSTPPSDDMLRGLTAPNAEEENDLDASPTAPQDAEEPAPQRTNSTPEAVQSQPSPTPTPSQPTASPSLQAPDSPQTVEPDFFYQGVNWGMEAAQLTQTAKTPDEWNAVARKWQQAIAAMRSVPSESRDYNLAQQKVRDYQSNLSYAQKQAEPPPRPVPSPSPQATQPQPSPSPSAEVAKPQPTASPSPETPDSPQTVEPDFFYDGINLGMEAAQLTQTAKTQGEWEAVAQKWQQAIAAMRSVPSDSRDYNLAQQKVRDYQSNLNYAQKQAEPPPRPVPSPSPQATQPQPSPSPSAEVAKPQPTASPSPETPDSPQTVEPDFFYDGINLGMEAAQLTQTAKTQGEWEAVAQKWQQAIAAMRSVPSDSRDYNLAQQKIQEYQSNLSYAQQMPNFFGQGVTYAMQAVELGQTAKTQGQWQQAAQTWQQAIAAMESVSPNRSQFAIAQQKVVEYDYYLDTLQGKIQSAIGRMTLKHAIRGSKISPKSVVYSGRGRFFVQNMMYSHTITVYNQQYELLKTISDTVNLSEYGHDEFPGTYRGAPVEATFSHGGQYAWVSNYQMYGSGFGNPGSDRCSPQAQHDP